MAVFSVHAFSGNGPVDPAGKGAGILGFGARIFFSMYDDDGFPSDKKSSHVGFLPTAFIGGSYFFNDLIGLNAEFGYNFAYASS